MTSTQYKNQILIYIMQTFVVEDMQMMEKWGKNCHNTSLWTEWSQDNSANIFSQVFEMKLLNTTS